MWGYSFKFLKCMWIIQRWEEKKNQRMKRWKSHWKCKSVKCTILLRCNAKLLQRSTMCTVAQNEFMLFFYRCYSFAKLKLKLNEQHIHTHIMYPHWRNSSGGGADFDCISSWPACVIWLNKHICDWNLRGANLFFPSTQKPLPISTRK